MTLTTKEASTVSDHDGLFAFGNLADGPATIEIRVQGFSTIKDQLIVASGMPLGWFELTLLSLEQLMAYAKSAPEQNGAPEMLMEISYKPAAWPERHAWDVQQQFIRAGL